MEFIFLLISITSSIISYAIVGYAYKERYSNKIIKISKIIISFSTFVIVLLGLIFSDYAFIVFIIFIHSVALLGKRYNAKKLSNKVESHTSTATPINYNFNPINKNKHQEQYSQESSNFDDYRYVSFLYEDAEGNITKRDVDVRSFDGEYLIAFCHLRRGLRTFRVDRILNDEIIIRNTGEIISLQHWELFI